MGCDGALHNAAAQLLHCTKRAASLGLADVDTIERIVSNVLRPGAHLRIKRKGGGCHLILQLHLHKCRAFSVDGVYGELDGETVVTSATVSVTPLRPPRRRY